MTGKTPADRQKEYNDRVREDKADLKRVYLVLQKHAAKFSDDLSDEDREFMIKLANKMNQERFKK